LNNLPPLFPTTEVHASVEKPTVFEGDALVLGLAEDWKSSEIIQAVNLALGGLLEQLISSEEISVKPNKITMIAVPRGLKVRNLITVGLGDPQKQDAGVFFRAAASAAKSLAGQKNRRKVGYAGFTADQASLQSAVCGSLTGGYGQDLFRKEPSLQAPALVTWFNVPTATIESAKYVAESINAAKTLVNLPPNYLHPESFADQAKKIAVEAGMEIEIWEQAKLEAERCNSLLAVARGSIRPPRLCIIKYAGTNPSLEPVALIGKGVTFDSGGYSLKPTDGMLTMKCDMAGAATVVGIMRAAAKLKIAQPIVGLVGLVENLVSGDAFKLGDVLTARSGKTIEIHNTDAEGRLVLADVIDVALQYKPKRMIDFATLTGACVVALGNDVTGVMSNDENWQEELLAASRRVGEYAWPLPMFSFFDEQIAGKVADIKNVGEGRWGGAITAAKFLEEFVAGTPWVHLDIAGPAFLDSPKSWTDAGATGTMIRSILDLLQQVKG
jgi:leucyl aminopeptidase